MARRASCNVVVALFAAVWLVNCTADAADSLEKQGMEAKAAAMLEEEEQTEQQIHAEALRYQKHYAGGAQEREVSDDDPEPPWETEQKKRKLQEETKREEERLEVKMSSAGDSHQDLGESQSVTDSPVTHYADLGEGASVADKDASTLSERAQEDAHQSIMETQAQKIAAKVRKLVKKQQSLEAATGKTVEGSVLGQATAEHDEALTHQSNDMLLAHKMEDRQALDTMQHLIETERSEQRKAIEEERSNTKSALTFLRSRLQKEQDKMVNQVRAETTEAVLNVQKDLSKSKIASTITDVVKKSLAKRLAELKAAGEKTVHDVSDEVQKLDHRVRRLRREQVRMKAEEDSVKQQTLLGASNYQRPANHDLGESASVNPLALEVERMRMEQMMQQQMMRPMGQPAPNNDEHRVLLEMEEQMKEMRAQNEQLKKMVLDRVDAPTTPQHYSHTELEQYFHKRKQNADLSAQISQEKARLSRLEQLQATGTVHAPQPQMLVELSEGPQSAGPIYNQHAEQSRIEMEDLEQRERDDAMSV